MRGLNAHCALTRFGSGTMLGLELTAPLEFGHLARLRLFNLRNEGGVRRWRTANRSGARLCACLRRVLLQP